MKIGETQERGNINKQRVTVKVNLSVLFLANLYKLFSRWQKRWSAHEGYVYFFARTSVLVPRGFADHPQRVLLMYGDSEAKEIARSLQKHIPVNKH